MITNKYLHIKQVNFPFNGRAVVEFLNDWGIISWYEWYIYGYKRPSWNEDPCLSRFERSEIGRSGEPKIWIFLIE